MGMAMPDYSIIAFSTILRTYLGGCVLTFLKPAVTNFSTSSLSYTESDADTHFNKKNFKE